MSVMHKTSEHPGDVVCRLVTGHNIWYSMGEAVFRHNDLMPISGCLDLRSTIIQLVELSDQEV